MEEDPKERFEVLNGHRIVQFLLEFPTSVFVSKAQNALHPTWLRMSRSCWNLSGTLKDGNLAPFRLTSSIIISLDFKVIKKKKSHELLMSLGPLQICVYDSA